MLWMILGSCVQIYVVSNARLHGRWAQERNMLDAKKIATKIWLHEKKLVGECVSTKLA